MHTKAQRQDGRIPRSGELKTLRLMVRVRLKKLVQSNSIIVESIIVENSIIVDNLPSTEDFYLIKIQNSRNSKIVEGFFWKGCVNLVFFSTTFSLHFQQECL